MREAKFMIITRRDPGGPTGYHANRMSVDRWGVHCYKRWKKWDVVAMFAN